MTATVATTNPAQVFDLARELDLARSAVGSGRLDRAREACQRILAHKADQPAALVLVGLTALKAGDAGQAIEAFEQATAIRPAHAEYQMLLGRAYLAVGRHADAAAAFRRAHEVMPGEPEPLLHLGKAEVAAGDTVNGAAHAQAALAIAKRRAPRALAMRFRLAAAPLRAALTWPAHRRRLACATALRRSTVAARSGADAKAREFLRAAVAADPRDAEAYVRLARRENKVRGWGAALAIYKQAADANVASVDLDVEHAFTLARLGRPLEARAMLDHALAARPGHRTALCMMGYVCRLLGKAEEGEGHYRSVLARNGADIRASYGVGRCRMDLGDTDEAETWLKRVLELDPDHGPAWRGLARIGRLRPEDAWFQRLEARLADAGLDTAARSSMHMAAGMVLDRAKQSDRAFAHFASGNRLVDVSFSPDAFDRHVDSLIATFDAAFFARIAEQGSANEQPLFIVGMPRSGTSLTEQIVASHPQVFGVGELDCFNVIADRLPETLQSAAPYPACAGELDGASLRAMAEGYLAELGARVSGDYSRITDKMPGNFLHVGLIAAAFPRARIVHCRRDPLDTCLSIYFQMFSGHHPYAYDLYKLGRYYRAYERLMAHWRAVLPGRILEMNYEELVADQHGRTADLLAFCGLPWDDACMDFHRTERAVRTASTAQVREPLNSRSVKRWQAYEDHLGPLQEGLAGATPAIVPARAA